MVLRSVFAELDQRFEAGFNPTLSIPADAYRSSTRPAGLLVIARLRDRPVGCGALKLHGRAPAEVKRMWVDRRPPAVRPRSAAPPRARTSRRQGGRDRRQARNQSSAQGGDRAISTVWLPRGRALQRRAVHAPLVRKATVVANRRWPITYSRSNRRRPRLRRSIR